jgi:hypothetical protein
LRASYLKVKKIGLRAVAFDAPCAWQEARQRIRARARKVKLTQIRNTRLCIPRILIPRTLSHQTIFLGDDGKRYVRHGADQARMTLHALRRSMPFSLHVTALGARQLKTIVQQESPPLKKMKTILAPKGENDLRNPERYLRSMSRGILATLALVAAILRS